MSLTSLFSTITTLALLLIIGYAAGKLKFIDSVSTERLSTLIVNIGQPFLIINSLISQEFSTENLVTGLKIMALGLGLHVFMAVIAFLLCRPIKDFDEQKLSEYAVLFANCGFMGFPILNSIFGAEGLFYGAFYIVSFYLFVWTWGLLIFARKRKDIKITPKKIILNFGTMPCLIGFLLFVSRIPMPEPILELSSYLASLCTPISILISGANLARRSLKKIFTNKNVYYVNLIKLIIMPVCVTLLLWLIGVPSDMIVFGAVMAAMPCAAIVTMFGEIYRVSPGYASELVGSSTLFCIITIFPTVTFAQLLASYPIW